MPAQQERITLDTPCRCEPGLFWNGSERRIGFGYLAHRTCAGVATDSARNGSSRRARFTIKFTRAQAAAGEKIPDALPSQCTLWL